MTSLLQDCIEIHDDGAGAFPVLSSPVAVFCVFRCQEDEGDGGQPLMAEGCEADPCMGS